MFQTTSAIPTFPAPIIMRRVKTGNVEYVGYATTGTAETTANWLITRNTYEASDGGISAVDFANKSTAFNQAWSQYASITIWG